MSPKKKKMGGKDRAGGKKYAAQPLEGRPPQTPDKKNAWGPSGTESELQQEKKEPSKKITKKKEACILRSGQVGRGEDCPGRMRTNEKIRDDTDRGKKDRKKSSKENVIGPSDIKRHRKQKNSATEKKDSGRRKR